MLIAGLEKTWRGKSREGLLLRFSLSVIFLLLLLIIPVSAAELSLNGGFEAGNTSNWTISNPNSHGSISVSGSYKYSGVYGCKVQNAGTGSETTSISQTFNFTNVQSISWWSRFNVTRAYGSGTGFVNVSISDVGSIWGNASGSTVGQNWTYHVWNNTGVTGNRTVTFSARGYVGPMFDDPTNSVIPALIVDDFSVYGSEGSGSSQSDYSSPDNQPVSYDWVCPAGVTRVGYTVIGPGGHGGAGGFGGYGTLGIFETGGGGGGGASGYKVDGYADVIPGNSYTISLDSSKSQFDVFCTADKGEDGQDGENAVPLLSDGMGGSGGVNGFNPGQDGVGSNNPDKHGWPGSGGQGAPSVQNGVTGYYGSGGVGGWGMRGYPSMDWPASWGPKPADYPFGGGWAWPFGVASFNKDPGKAGNLGHVSIIPVVYNNQTVNNNNVPSNTTNVSNYPIAAFAASVTSGYIPFTVTFTDQSSGSPTSWYWDFGDGNTSTSQNPTHQYSSVGNFNIKFKATNTYGSSWQNSTYIVANPSNPSSDFIASPVDGNFPLNVQFSDRSDPSITSWNWNFGDGGSSTLKNPSHTYNSVGNYAVSLTVTSPGGTNTTTKNSYIHVYGGNAPYTQFSANPVSGRSPLNVQFSDQSNGATSWNWDFGDGNTSTSQNPTHTYYLGTYTVKLTTSNAFGVNDLVKVAYISVSSSNTSLPVASFVGTPLSGNAPLTVGFTDTSSGSPNSWYWQFGDGNHSNLQNPSHTYYSPGTYRIDFIATNSYGSSFLAKDGYITVIAGNAENDSGGNGSGSVNYNFLNNTTNNFYNFYNNTTTTITNVYEFFNNTTDESDQILTESGLLESINTTEANALSPLTDIANFIADKIGGATFSVTTMSSSMNSSMFNATSYLGSFTFMPDVWSVCPPEVIGLLFYELLGICFLILMKK